MRAERGWFDTGRFLRALQRCDPVRTGGTVMRTAGLLIESRGPAAAVGDFCEICTRSGARIRTQVIGFRDGLMLSMPLEETSGLQPGDPIVARPQAARVAVSGQLLGRVLDGFGQPMDAGPPIDADAFYDLYAAPPGPLEREPIHERLETGIRVIDGFLTVGRGQRVGIFGGSGVGKSTLLGSLVKNSDAEVCVLALVGERNREVRDFIEHELGPEGMRRSVLVVATSDRPSPLRVRACFVALAVAEFFRDQGRHVLLVADSVTRLAMAQREIGLAAGEPPSQKGYTPSVFQMLPRIFERAGNFRRGSITGFFTVLVEGDDLNEPITDAVRGILDGHIVLSRALANAGHYPAIDVLHSVSRLAPRLAGAKQREAAARLREALAVLHASEDLIRIGAYAAGTNPQLDTALKLEKELKALLRQRPEERTPFEELEARMARLAELS
ncbi:MAG: EscN/YscN/HrcN family type III secretion system ATPase [Bryobacteraceae bacterium]|nr:MAG: EscN/YscN/HrcN family type III secretion system ATPase [Bryobacteraceae bacterium]